MNAIAHRPSGGVTVAATLALPSISKPMTRYAADLVLANEARAHRAHSEAPAPREVLTPDQIAASRAKVAALKSETAARQIARPTAQPRYLTPEQLAATRANNPIIQTALKMQAKMREAEQ
jgi:hypothetical protein